jgi:arginyl-tRNA synthetase
MKISHDTTKLKLAKIIGDAAAEINCALTLDEIYEQITLPPDTGLGHYAFPCFALSRELKASPADIAKQLAGYIGDNEVIEKTVAAGPYLNFMLTGKFLGETVGGDILDQKMFKRKLIADPPKTMIEYSQPNTHKELHVGHMRNLCLGDALIKLHQYAGFEIISSTFPGDVGAHVAKCLWYLKYHNQEEVPTENKGAWLGTLYSKGHAKLEEEKDTPQEDENRRQLSEILTQLENEEGEFFELWKETRQWSIELMEKAYSWADVKFDRWYWESEVDVPSVELAKKYYEMGLFVKSEGAIGVDLSEYKLGFCMLLKSDGHGLYATKDIELARRKFEDFNIEKSVYIVDKRQALHFAQVFKVLELMGFQNAKNCYHLQYDYVELPEGAMSSRKGNIVPLMDLIEQMHQMVKQEYLEKYRGDWPDEEIELTADVISKGAIKYGMLRFEPNRKIVFDLKEWLKIDGESGPYLQYTYARINSLIKKVGAEVGGKIDWSVLTENPEKQLLVKLSEFNSEALYACLEYKPNVLCAYLYELCRLYNSFYTNVPIRTAATETLTVTRLALSESVAWTLKQGLSLLGIPVPERM